MRVPFNPMRGLVVVSAHLWGPRGDEAVRLALDTGATITTVSAAILVLIGCDPAGSRDRVQTTTGSGIEFLPRIPVDRIEALGQQRTSFRVLSHTLPPTAVVDGVLGLDFMRALCLTVDFRAGTITLI